MRSAGGMSLVAVDVLIPTYQRPGALALTLCSLIGQTCRDFRVIVSDQTEGRDSLESGEVRAIFRLLELRGHAPRLIHHLPRQGMAEQRQFLLDQASSPYALFIDDDVLLEPTLLERMLLTIREQN